MQSVMNRKIKFRESFRPFAPAVLKERVADYFEIDRETPYMLLVAPVAKALRKDPPDDSALKGLEKLSVLRSEIPAVTHVDFSARIQTVDRAAHPLYYDTINEFYRQTGTAVIINTSFNVRGEPIVCRPEEAYACFMRTNMDYLVIGNFLLDKKEQPEMKPDETWKTEFVPD